MTICEQIFQIISYILLTLCQIWNDTDCASITRTTKMTLLDWTDTKSQNLQATVNITHLNKKYKDLTKPSQKTVNWRNACQKHELEKWFKKCKTMSEISEFCYKELSLTGLYSPRAPCHHSVCKCNAMEMRDVRHFKDAGKMKNMNLTIAVSAV
jgi:hypothetical protein